MFENMTKNGTLYLIPTFIGTGDEHSVTDKILKVIYSIREFIVETEKTARAFLKSINHPLHQSEFIFHILNEHTGSTIDLSTCFASLKAGDSIGLMSDAGIPCMADPGSVAVSYAHKNGIRVVPLPGESSIYLALMASGLNGQNFAFNGYLPVKPNERTKKILQLESISIKQDQTQLFMETPYRNQVLFENLVKILQPSTRMCIASNIGQENEFIYCTEIRHWKNLKADLHKIPVIFLIGR